MQDKRPTFKIPSKKHHPKGLSIIYEDYDIVVVDKINGLLTVSTSGEKEKTAYFLLTDYVKKGNSRSKNRVFIVHRLDRDTSGILIFAKTEKVKHYLQNQWKDFSKTYFAVVHGKLQEKEGIITSYLVENKAHKMYSVNDSKKGKFSQTGYSVVKESRKFSLLKINLITGTKNQIRVQFSEIGHSVVGDKVYGEVDKSNRRLALHASSLTILHPFTKQKMVFESKSPQYFNTLVN